MASPLGSQQQNPLQFLSESTSVDREVTGRVNFLTNIPLSLVRTISNLFKMIVMALCTGITLGKSQYSINLLKSSAKKALLNTLRIPVYLIGVINPEEGLKMDCNLTTRIYPIGGGFSLVDNMI